MRLPQIELRRWNYNRATKYLIGWVVTSEDELWVPGDEFMGNVQSVEDVNDYYYFFSNTTLFRCPKGDEIKKLEAR